jgi:YHS domain-containing protein
VIAAFLLLAALHAPEECIVLPGVKGAKPVASVEHNAKTYHFRFADCREEFLSDPERYAQLYDTLLELHAAGSKIEAPRASLVPS